MLSPVIDFCLRQKLVVLLLLGFFIGWGVRVAPFDWAVSAVPRDPVAVDAIPNLGDNQQIIFTEWSGRSPRDVDDQITYPLTVNLLGVPGVREVRSYSYFGFSTIYLIFEEDIEFYWSRSRILEKLNSLPAGTLPEGATPSLGPDATGLGQIFWYTLEGHDPDGNLVGGWNLDELRAIQDWQVRYALQGTAGVSEVSSIGGFVREYQVDVDPDKLRSQNLTLRHVAEAVRKSNNETGARNLAINGAEYLIRARGYIDSIKDLEQAVVASRGGTPIKVADLGTVSLGPAQRRGALDKNGAEAVGGVVVARFGENPLTVIKNTKEQIGNLTTGLPERGMVLWEKTTPEEVATFRRDVLKLADGSTENEFATALTSHLQQTARADWPAWATLSKVTIVPFYDRTQLIGETLGTLNDALYQQILITIIVVLIMVLHLRTSVLISAMLPLAVLITFITMKIVGVDANIVSLAGIAIAIGTVVDIGIILTENILNHLREADPEEPRLEVIRRATVEVAGAVTTSVATTVTSFLPVFLLTGANGRLYRPLAYTKTFALAASLLVAITIIPPVAHMLMRRWKKKAAASKNSNNNLKQRLLSGLSIAIAVLVGWLLAKDWAPLGLDRADFSNFVFVALLIGTLLFAFWLFQKCYTRILGWCLEHKAAFLSIPAMLILLAILIAVGFTPFITKLPGGDQLAASALGQSLQEKFPGLPRENRPRLDEGSFLLMPTTSPHASIGEAIDVMKRLDAAVAAIPEVTMVVGKIGRAESALDPAPISMLENVVQYAPEFKEDKHGRPIKFRYDRKRGQFLYDDNGKLIADDSGRPYRNWRPHIKTAADIWDEIAKAATLPGTTAAPMLQPIETRLVMLQTGMRAPMGLKLKGPDLETLERAALDIESALKNSGIRGLNPATVIADRVVGKPYLEIIPDRAAASRYGLNVADIHQSLQMAVGGHRVTTTVEGRERFAVRVRYPREKRDNIQALGDIQVPASDGTHIPLSQLANIRYIRGPQMIKSEDTFLTAYVTFDKTADATQIDVVNRAKQYLENAQDDASLRLPAGVTYRFAGSYEEAQEFSRNLTLILPITLFVIFILIYLQFRSVPLTLILFSGIAVAISGGFLMLWLYGQPGFLDFSVFGINLAEMFNIGPVALSTAVVVGFIALFGIATDDGVVIATYLKQSFEKRDPESREEIRRAVIAAGKRRVRPCLMTTATTLLALLPVLTSTGKGADIMAPMAIPIFGGMTIELLTMFVVPTLYCTFKERKIRS